MSDVANIFKIYKLDELLCLLGEISRKMYFENSPIKEVSWQRNFGRFKQQGTLYITPWDLVDISYNAILYSNDYKSKIASDKDFLKILAQFKNYDNEISEVNLNSVEKEDLLLYITFGHSQKQFWYQNIKGGILNQFNRNVELLQYIPKQINCRIDFDTLLFNEFGFNLEEFNQILVFLLAIGLNKVDITNIEINKTVIQKTPCCNKKNLEKVFVLYKGGYKDYIKSDLNQNYLFLKPIVETDTHKLIILNQYLLAKLLSDGLYWIFRNIYFCKGSQEFTNEFGKLFEKHIENVLDYYLHNTPYHKIDCHKNHKIADWIIETDKYNIIVEQKSTIASIKLKTIYLDIKGLKQYIGKFNEAIEQLNETEQMISNNKITIKLIVHYETLYVTEILKEELLKGADKSEKDVKNIFFVSISEMETLIYLIGNKKQLFDQIIAEKIKLENEKSLNGTSFNMIFSKLNKSINNDYLEQYKNHFDRFVDKWK